MACLNRMTCNESEGLVAAISLGTSYYLGLALLTILVVVLLVYAYRVWEEIHEDIESDTPGDLLDTFEEAHAAGELDQEELSRVRQLLLQENGDLLAKNSPPMSPVNSGPIEESPAIGDTSSTAQASGEPHRN